MKKLDYYKIKYNALDNFYLWIDQGSDYNIAVDQAFYSSYEMEEVEELIFIVTIALRFAMTDKEISDEFKESLKDTIKKIRKLNLAEYGLNDEEVQDFNDNIEDVEILIK